MVEGLEPVLEAHGGHPWRLGCRVVLDAVVGRVVEELVVEVFEEQFFEVAAPSVVQGYVGRIGYCFDFVEQAAAGPVPGRRMPAVPSRRVSRLVRSMSATRNSCANSAE